MNNYRLVITLIIFLCLSLFLSGCDSSSGGGLATQSLASISISPASAELAIDGSQTFTATGIDTQGQPMTIAPEWNLAAETIIGTVTVNGASCTFTASDAGIGTLTATQGSITSDSVAITVIAAPAPTPPPNSKLKFFFLHHSVGENLIQQGNVRGNINSYNSANGTSYEFWDHGYNDQGLFNGTGEATGISYSIPEDNTNPDGLYNLWTNSGSDWTYSRDQIMSSDYKVIVFKSCFVALENLNSVETLSEWKSWYLEIRNYFDAHTDKLFVIVTPPPLRSVDTNSNNADLARQLSDWLKSSEYLSGHSNVACYDLFDALADSNNVLRPEYESEDSHPNEVANQNIGPVFANFLCNSARNYFGQ